MTDKKTKIDDIKILGKNLKRYRQFKGFTQEQLATKVGLTKNIISNIETANQEIEDIDIKYIILFSRELDIGIGKLFRKDPKNFIIEFMINEKSKDPKNFIIEFMINEKSIEALKRIIRSCEKLFKVRED